MTMTTDFNTTLARLRPHYDYCGGAGGHWVAAHWDSGHPDSWSACKGCRGCIPAISLAAFFSVFDKAPALAGFAALAAVGAAVKAALSPGWGVAKFAVNAVATWNGPPVKGAWYEVTGKRGTAKKHVGTVGECFWVREDAYTRYGRTTYTTRVGLRPAAGEAVFVPASCVTRVAVPAAALPAIAAKEAAAAEKAARTPFVVSKGTAVTVTHGTSAGKIGRVFWTGSGKGGLRYGLDPDLDRKRGRCPDPLWVDARDCAAYVAPVKAAKVAFPAAPAPAPAIPAAVAPAPAPAAPTAKKLPKIVFEKPRPAAA